MWFNLIQTAQAQVSFKPSGIIPGVLACGDIGPSYLACYIGALYNFFIQFAIVLAVLMILIGGFQWLMAIGNPGRISSAKATINGAIIGLILALTSYLLFSQINRNLVNLQSLNIDNITGIPALERAGVPGSLIDLCTDIKDQAACIASEKDNVCRWDNGCKANYFSGSSGFVLAASVAQGNQLQMCCILWNKSTSTPEVADSVLLSSPDSLGYDACRSLIFPLKGYVREDVELSKGSCQTEYRSYQRVETPPGGAKVIY